MKRTLRVTIDLVLDDAIFDPLDVADDRVGGDKIVALFDATAAEVAATFADLHKLNADLGSDVQTAFQVETATVVTAKFVESV